MPTSPGIDEPARVPSGPAAFDRAFPIERGPFFVSRFVGSAEGEFRTHYRRVFRGRMRAMWGFAVLAWIGAWCADPMLFPEAAMTMAPLRVLGLAILIAAAVAVSLGETIGPRIHTLTCLAGAGIALCTVALFTLVPYPRSFPLFTTLTAILVLSTVFFATLHVELSAVASLVVLVVFAVVVVTIESLTSIEALGLAGGAGLVAGLSLACTHTIEQYARENFAQRGTLELQSAALAEKATELQVSETKARDANLAKSVFLSNMSHELRTPLNAVLGFARLLGRDATLSPEGRRNLEIIEVSGDHLLSLINDVLAISKIEAGRLTVSEQPFDPRSMIATVCEMARVRAEAKGLQMIVEVDAGLPAAAVGDEGKLRQIIVNLLGNAVKFTDEGGVAVRAKWTGERVLVEIEDTGFGIAAEELGGLFEAFAQTESGRQAKEGTGLGLAISRNFARLMGGDIRVASALGRGTTFTLDVPLRATEPSRFADRPRRVLGLAAGERRRRVLVVDDTAANRLLLTELLRAVGFDVREATNGAEAVRVWDEWRPELIWMDMRMPIMDGGEATRRIRELAGGAACKILALTASAFQHDRERILDGGCDDFVTKPFREETIFEKLAEHLGVRFEYEAAAASEETPRDPRVEIVPERLRALPAGLVRELHTAIASGDITAAGAIAARVRAHDEPLAEALEGELRAFRVDGLLDVLETLDRSDQPGVEPPHGAGEIGHPAG